MVIQHNIDAIDWMPSRSAWKYSKNGHLAHNWYWTIGREMKNCKMNDIEIHVNSCGGQSVSTDRRSVSPSLTDSRFADRLTTDGNFETLTE